MSGPIAQGEHFEKMLAKVVAKMRPGVWMTVRQLSLETKFAPTTISTLMLRARDKKLVEFKLETAEFRLPPPRPEIP